MQSVQNDGGENVFRHFSSFFRVPFNSLCIYFLHIFGQIIVEEYRDEEGSQKRMLLFIVDDS